MKPTSLLVLLTSLVACGGAADPGGPDADPGNQAFPPPPDGEGVQLALTTDVAPGEERYVCRYLVLPDRAMDVSRFAHAFGAGTHHLLLYPTDLTADQVASDGESFDCTSRGDLHQTGVIYGGTESTGELPYPDGVGMRLAARAVVLLEAHELNATDATITADARINLWFAASPVTTLAGTLFFNDWAILVPTAPATAHAEMRCEVPAPISLLYAVSHMHRRGTGFAATVETPGAKPAPLYSSDRWDAPTPAVYLPPREVPAGATIDFGCDYQNDLGHPVVQGPSADQNEMCLFVASYYPKLPDRAELCETGASAPVLAGDQTCKATVDCMLAAGVGDDVGGQTCISHTCAGSAPALAHFLVCVQDHQCWGSEACVAAHCAPEYGACSSASCGG